MKAVICTRYGPPEVLQIREVPKPLPGEKEICIRIMATAANSGDVKVRSLDVNGIMRIVMRLVLGFSKPRKPVLGTVYAGFVESVGSKVTTFKTGDRVFGMTGFKFGTYAEYIAVNQHSNICFMPEKATFEEAAALIFGGQTAIRFLHQLKIEKKPAPKILIIGATGSVGVAAIQIANYYKAKITAVCSSNGQALVKSLGVKNVILYDKEDFTQLSTRFDIVFDAVGYTTKKMCLHLLTQNGLYKNVLYAYASESKEQLQFLKELFEQGAIKAVIDKTFQLDEIVAAHRYVGTKRKKGNVVIKIG